MIDFIILPDTPDVTALEFVRAYISYDCKAARYSPEVRDYSPDQIDAFQRKAMSVKCPETGEAWRIVPLKISDKIREHEEGQAIFKAHVGGYLNHPLRTVLAREIERSTANHGKSSGVSYGQRP
ncbi:hypothetical protein SJ05684_c21840 [Sinorhizobium sojae CCBAU 05684]|uniref:Uncharacterized protein n=1 Tax=Sinorhizobium sojae CCBAU 05684 TaxID=716928 RepID=A0A249PCY4_9HYPH|nr:hypothetical protein [Sinorhizobium sojae]ASY63625.1 hypothetical protein SJ05684_c21840 [Sinorhizobium sojae CCBAU 05684]